MTGIEATSHAISGIARQRTTRRGRWTLTAIYVITASAFIALLLAAAVALTPASPTPGEMRLHQPIPGGAEVQIGPVAQGPAAA